MTDLPITDNLSVQPQSPDVSQVEEITPPTPKIDIQALAREVYQVMKEDMRYDRERQGKR